MKITWNRRLQDFPFWGGAKFLAHFLTFEEFWKIEAFIKEADEKSGQKSTFEDINNMFWNDVEEIVQFLGYRNFDDFFEKRVVEQ